MNSNNTKSNYIWYRNRKEALTQYLESNTGTYINKADSNYYHYRNNRWQPYCLQKYCTTPGEGNTSKQYHQQQNFQQSHYPQFVNQIHKPLEYRNLYQVRNTKQPWLLSQPTSTVPNTMVQSTVNSMDTYKQSTSSHDMSSYHMNINVNNQSLTSVGQQVKILEDRGVTTNINITEPYSNCKQDGHSLSKLCTQDGQPDDGGSGEMRVDVNNIQDDQKYKTVEREPKSMNNQVKWEKYKAKHGNDLKIKSEIPIKSTIDKAKDNTCNLKHDHMVDCYFENNQKEKEMCELESTHNETKWKLYKIEHGNELKVKSNLTPMYTLESEEKMNNSLPNFNRKYLTINPRSLIEKLYSGKQCSTCGERGFSNDKDHMDGHFREKYFERNAIYPKYRYWYLEDNDDDNSFVSLLKEDQKKTIKLSKGPRHNPDNDVCLVCKEKFCQFFNDEDGEWQVKDAIILDGKIYHEICFDDRDNI